MLEFLENSVELPEVIILDMNIPGNECHECLIRIKNETRTSHIPIFIWSTAISETVKSKAIEHGAVNYILKPSSLEDLKSEIMQILKMN